MSNAATAASITREKLIDALNEDLAREYQAIIAYVNYSQVLKGAAYMNIAGELTVHAKQELDHALQVAESHRLSGGDAFGNPQAGEDFRKGRRHASVRSGE